MFFTVEEAQAAQAKEEKLKMTQYSLQIDSNTDRLIHCRELYCSPMLNNFFLKKTKQKQATPTKKQIIKKHQIKKKIPQTIKQEGRGSKK